MLIARKRAVAAAGAALLGIGLAVTGGSAAQAFSGGSLPPNSTVCTNQVSSDRGVAFYGYASSPTAQWTVYAATTADAPETALLQLPTKEPTTTYVSWPGVFHYRLCITNTSATTGALRFAFFPQFGAGSTGTAGAFTAVLGPSGRYCAPTTSTAARLIGTSTVPVHWSAEVENFNADFLRVEDYGTSAEVDRAVAPDDDEIFKACATNTSGATASLSFRFS